MSSLAGNEPPGLVSIAICNRYIANCNTLQEDFRNYFLAKFLGWMAGNRPLSIDAGSPDLALGTGETADMFWRLIAENSLNFLST
jgi:hypothetical protein